MPKPTRDTEVPADDAGEVAMNIIIKWAASKLLEDWTETTWWPDVVLPEFERDSSNVAHAESEIDAASIDTLE